MKIFAFCLPPEHPVFAGHFPGMPIVPGVMLLDAVCHAVANAAGRGSQQWHVKTVKFLNPLAPGETASARYDITNEGTVRFEIVADGRAIATGHLAWENTP